MTKWIFLVAALLLLFSCSFYGANLSVQVARANNGGGTPQQHGMILFFGFRGMVKSAAGSTPLAYSSKQPDRRKEPA